MAKRLIGIFCLLCFLFTGLCMRIGSIATNQYYVQAGAEQSSYTLTARVKRGTIYDTNHKPLVNRTKVYMASILVTAENAAEVADITGLSAQEVAGHLKDGKPFLHQVDVRHSDDDNIIVFPVATRYEEDQLAPHLIGYLSEGKGVSGLEKSYDNELAESTQEIKVTYTLNAMGQAIQGVKPVVEYSDSNDSGIVLTLDADIQRICENAGQDIQKGAVVVMETATGKLRGAASFPTYSTYALSEAMASGDAPMLNRALTPLSVGSTFKVAITAAALEQGVSPSLQHNCTGGYTLAETVMHCHRREGHGILDMENALIQSCNPYFINLGLQLNSGRLLRVANSMSFGKRYELAPGLYTQGGSLPKEPVSQGQVANLSFGQGDLLATPVQLAQMISCIANNGKTPTPSLVEGKINEAGTWVEQAETPLGIQAVRPETAGQIQQYLIASANAEGQNAQPRFTTAGGKTATAQTGTYKDGEEINYGWFVGFTSADDPKYAIVVITEDAESGNIDASPVFAEIADEIALVEKGRAAVKG